jgi:hypothetical protein
MTGRSLGQRRGGAQLDGSFGHDMVDQHWLLVP